MEDINPTLSVITLNVNGLNTAQKAETVKIDLKKKGGGSNYMLLTRNTIYLFIYLPCCAACRILVP